MKDLVVARYGKLSNEAAPKGIVRHEAIANWEVPNRSAPGSRAPKRGSGACLRLLFTACVVGLTATLCCTAATAQRSPVSTQVTVRAVSHDAKIIGSGVGGARIVIRNPATGAVLAEGIQEGGTGDTERIIQAPRDRDATVYDTEGAAKFSATVSIAEPTMVDITAFGPLQARGFVPQSSKRLILVPGQDVTGEGIILELNGFTVDRLEWDLVPEQGFRVRSSVTMLCGCPTEPGGLWDADDIHVSARLLDGLKIVAESELPYAGTTSTFAGTLSAPDSGEYVLEVTASEPAEGNFGVARRTVTF